MTETTTSIDALYNRAAQAELRGEDFAIPAKLAMSLLEHVNALRHNLEAERQQREAAEAELAALRGKQEPFRYVVVKENVNIGYTQTLEDADFMSLQHGGVVIPLYASQPKPVVVLSDCTFEAVSHMAHWYTEGECVAFVSEVEHAKKQMLAAGIVVRDGE